MSDKKDGVPAVPVDPEVDRNLERAKERVERLKALMTGEMKKAMEKPRSPYGGPVRLSSGIPMKFPYTFTAKFVQFPWKFYIKNQWMWRYFLIAVVVCLPIFKKISNLANSPGNKAKWAAQQKKDEHH